MSENDMLRERIARLRRYIDEYMIGPVAREALSGDDILAGKKMKLKHKLANDYALPVGTGRFKIEKEALERGFLSGFEKAREMAYDRFQKKTMMRPKDKSEGFGMNTVIMNGEWFEFTVEDDFRKSNETK